MQPKDPVITIKITVPYRTFDQAQEVSKTMVEACRKAANARAKPAKVVFVKVEE